MLIEDRNKRYAFEWFMREEDKRYWEKHRNWMIRI